MRIALTHAYSWPEVRRGAERIIYDLSRALAARGNDVTVLTSGSQPERTTDDAGVHIVKMKRRFAKQRRHEAQFGAAVIPRLTASRFDAVHSLGPLDAAGAVIASNVRRHRTVYTNLGLPMRSFWEADRRQWATVGEDPGARPFPAAHRLLVRDVDVYGCMSRAALDILRSEYGREGTLTPGGVDIQQFRPAATRASEPTILFSASLGEPRKGGTQLVEAFGMLLRKVPNARLWLSGPGDAARLLADASSATRERIDVLGVGEAQGQAERYGRAWVTALPSKWDSFGLVVVESLACGTPVVASNHSALPELLQPGTTGFLCEPDDPATIADGLERALDLSQRPDIAETCRSSVAQYDWLTGIAPSFEKIYAGEAIHPG